MSKKPYSEYDCPVCQQKDIQQGSFGKHLVRHTTAELLPYVKNTDKVVSEGTHPEIHVNGAIFAICPNTTFGYQKGILKPLINEKRHTETCKNLYHTWPQEKVDKTSIVNCFVSKTTEPVTHETEAAPLAINTHTADILSTETNVIIPNCSCHIEITQLKAQIQTQTQELEVFRAWRQLVISSAPQISTTQNTVVVPQAQPKVLKPKQVRIVEPKAKPSKKEKEKGMWCETCETCKQVAQFASDLRACAKCKKMCHFNDDLVGCYHFDCEICAAKICITCVKAAGPKSNKMHSMCSTECYKKYMAKR